MKDEFRIYSPLTAKSVTEFITKDESTDTERILLEGVASTTNRDLQDEVVSSSAIESMSEQALALNIHGDHFYGLDDVVGAIKDAVVEDNQLRVKFLVTKKYTPDIRDLLETGVNLGLSIGGRVSSYDEKNRIINAIRLHEISLTAMPANWDTFGTVTNSKGLTESNCVTGACHAIMKNLEVDKMAEDVKQEEEVSTLTEDKVIELINEYMAEKEETIAQEITDKVDSNLEAIVETKVQELIGAEEEVVEEEEAKAEEDKEEEKHLSSEDISKAINDAIENALGDDFADTVASKMFGNIDKERTPETSKFEQYLKSIEQEESTTEESDNVYSSQKAAEALIKKQGKVNPITAAALKQL